MTVWDALAGSRAAEGLAAQVARAESAQAWLLLGPPGSGKGAAAAALAASLNCLPTPRNGCGECSACRRILRGRHPDVHHIAPEGPLIPVDVVRDVVIPEAARSPFEGRYKVFVIEEADRMNDAAQNALLKTLEEPQPDTVFVLISDNEEDLLETIRSRCRVVRLEPVSEQRMVEMLARAGAAEADARVAARLSEGDVERARSLATGGDSAQRRATWITIPARLSSPVDALDAATEIVDIARVAVKERETQQKDEVVELAEAIGEGRGTATARQALAKRHRREVRRLEEEVLGEALSWLASFYRDVLAVRSGAPDPVANLDLLDELEWWATAGVDDRALVRAIERLVAARASLPRNANVPLAIESALVEVAALVSPPASVAADV